jgi:hypothetical protein
MVYEDLILLYQETLDTLPKLDIRCETAHCSGSCTDAALPPQEVPSNMFPLHKSHIYSHFYYYGKEHEMYLTNGATHE